MTSCQLVIITGLLIYGDRSNTFSFFYYYYYYHTLYSIACCWSVNVFEVSGVQDGWEGFYYLFVKCELVGVQR